MGEELDAKYALYGLVGRLYFYVDWRGIANSGRDHIMVVNTYLHEVCWSVQFTTFVNSEDGVLLSIVAVELNEGLDKLE